MPDPSLFDEIEPDGTRTTGIFRAPAPTKAHRRPRVRARPPPPVVDELSEVAADARRRWEERVREARAHAEEGADGV